VTLSLTHQDLERSWCIVKGSFGTNATCEWLPYVDEKTIELAADVDTEIRVQSTAKVPTYLYSYPKTQRFVSLNARSPTPSVVILNHPLEVVASGVLSGDVYIAFYGLESDIPANTRWFAFPAKLTELRIRPSLEFAATIHASNCTSGQVCKIAVIDGIPEKPIAVPADAQFVCAWLQTEQMRESLPNYGRIEESNLVLTVGETIYNRTCDFGPKSAVTTLHSNKRWAMLFRNQENWERVQWICDVKTFQTEETCAANISLPFTFETETRTYKIETRWQLTPDRYTELESHDAFTIRACETVEGRPDNTMEIIGITMGSILGILILLVLSNLARGDDPEVKKWTNMLQDLKRNTCVFCHGERRITNKKQILLDTIVHCCNECGTVLEKNGLDKMISLTLDRPEIPSTGSTKISSLKSARKKPKFELPVGNKAEKKPAGKPVSETVGRIDPAEIRLPTLLTEPEPYPPSIAGTPAAVKNPPADIKYSFDAIQTERHPISVRLGKEMIPRNSSENRSRDRTPRNHTRSKHRRKSPREYVDGSKKRRKYREYKARGSSNDEARERSDKKSRNKKSKRDGSEANGRFKGKEEERNGV